MKLDNGGWVPCSCAVSHNGPCESADVGTESAQSVGVAGVTVGRVVQLRSGGPAMTITRRNPVDIACEQATCTWFVDGNPVSAVFPLAALR